MQIDVHRTTVLQNGKEVLYLHFTVMCIEQLCYIGREGSSLLPFHIAGI